jgi:hypothetical protein
MDTGRIARWKRPTRKVKTKKWVMIEDDIEDYGHTSMNGWKVIALILAILATIAVGLFLSYPFD